LKAILIDPFAKSVMEVTLEDRQEDEKTDNYKSQINELLDGPSAFGTTTYLGNELVTEYMAVYKHTQMFRLEGVPDPIAGKALLWNWKTGELTVDAFKLSELVTWVE
jgi:hypothetical protein